MSDKITWVRWQLVAAALFLSSVPLAFANSAPQVSGSYNVVQETALGSQQQIQLRIHLVNHGASGLSIQRMTVWDFSHPDKGGTRACAIALGAHASADTTQEFTIRSADYQMWKKGLQPRLVLQVAGPGNTRSKIVVRLDRDSSKEVQ
jgi:hypothetical protein